MESLIREKDIILLDYARDTGLKLKNVKEAKDGFKKLQVVQQSAQKPSLDSLPEEDMQDYTTLKNEGDSFM